MQKSLVKDCVSDTGDLISFQEFQRKYVTEELGRGIGVLH